MSATGEVYNTYKSGPSTEPWGTPESRDRREDLQPSTSTQYYGLAPNGMTIRHIDGDYLNDKLSNLELKPKSRKNKI